MIIKLIKHLIYKFETYQTPLKFKMDLRKLEVPISILYGLRCKLLKLYPGRKGLRILLSSNDELEWKRRPHGRSFWVLGRFYNR